MVTTHIVTGNIDIAENFVQSMRSRGLVAFVQQAANHVFYVVSYSQT